MATPLRARTLSFLPTTGSQLFVLTTAPERARGLASSTGGVTGTGVPPGPSLVVASPVAATGRLVTALAAATSRRGAGHTVPVRAPTTTAARTSASVAAPPPTSVAPAAVASVLATTPKPLGHMRPGGSCIKHRWADNAGTLCTSVPTANGKSLTSRCAPTAVVVGSTRPRGALKEDAIWGLIHVESPHQYVERCTSYLVGTPIFLYGRDEDGSKGEAHPEVAPLRGEVEEKLVPSGRAEAVRRLISL